MRARLTDWRGRGIAGVRCSFIWRQAGVVLYRSSSVTTGSGEVADRRVVARATPGEVVHVVVRCTVAGRTLRATAEFVPQPPLPATPRIVFIGDSLTRGLYASSEKTMFRELVTASVPCTADVLISSDGRSGGMDLARVASAAADIYVIDLGTNDASGAPTGIVAPPEEVAQNLQRIVAAARDGNPACRIVFLTIWQYRYLREAYDEQIVALSRSTGKHVVDIGSIKDDPRCAGPRDVETPWGLSDFWHPNDRGHAAIAGRVETLIRRLLRLSGVPAD